MEPFPQSISPREVALFSLGDGVAADEDPDGVRVCTRSNCSRERIAVGRSFGEGEAICQGRRHHGHDGGAQC